MSETTRCPTCGSDGVTACVGLDGSDHPGRPPFFDEKATAALDSMKRLDKGLAP
jgi:hypothetical protein